MARVYLDRRGAVPGRDPGEAFYRPAAGAAGWGKMPDGFIALAVLGNAVGGVLLVALLNYGQVAAERRRAGQQDVVGAIC